MTEQGSEQVQENNVQSASGLPKSDQSYRIFAVVLIIAGAVCAKFFIFDYLESIRAAHNSAVLIHSKLIMLAPVLVTLGLTLLIGAGRALRAVQDVQRSSFNAKKVFLIILMILPSIGVQIWVESELQKMGYQTDDR